MDESTTSSLAIGIIGITVFCVVIVIYLISIRCEIRKIKDELLTSATAAEKREDK